MLKETIQLIRHEFKLEFKQKHFVSSMLLYIVTTIFVCYLSFNHIEEANIWNGLFWIIVLFSLTNAISKSFLNENSNQQLFLYTLLNPKALILGKMVYNLILTLFLVLVSFIVFSMLIKTNNQEMNKGLFAVSCLFGGMSISTVLTMIGAIAAKTNNNLGLLSILAFPIVLPSLLIAINLSSLAFLGGTWEQATESLILLTTINILVIALAFLLFPYLWRE